MRPIAQSGFVSSSVGGVLLLSNADGCWCRLCSDVLVLVVVVFVVVLLLLQLGTAVVVAATVSNVASATLTDDVTTGAVLVAGLVSSTRLRTAHARSISIIRSTLTLPSLVLAAAMSFRRKSAMYAASMTTPASSVGGGDGLEGDAAVLVATVSPVALHLFLYSSIDSLRGCAGGVVCGCDVCFWLKTKSIRLRPPDVVIVGGFLLKTISNRSSMAAVLPLSFNAFRIFVESMLLASSPAGVASVAAAVMSGVVELTVAASACSVSATRFTGDDDGEWYFSRGLGGGDLDLYRR